MLMIFGLLVSLVFSNIFIPYLRFEAIESNDVQLLGTLTVIIFGLIGMLVTAKKWEQNQSINANADIIIEEDVMYLELRNTGTKALKRVYIILHESTLKQAKKLDLNIERINYRGVPLDVERYFKIRIASIEEIKNMDDNFIKFGFKLIFGNYEKIYNFSLKSYVLDL
ncbi:MAG: hypothetical protein FWE36_00085 [Erysipelotrichales bacterium]|nr:hypothetical protein [Erysipelotrichales bacterium]